MEQHQRGQLIDGVSHGVPYGVNHAAGLSHRVTQGPLRRVRQLFGQGVTAEDLPLGRRHFDIPGGPETGGGQGAPGPGLIGVVGFQRLDGLLRQIQGPQDQNPAVLPGEQLGQTVQQGTVLGKQEDCFAAEK